MLNVLVYARRIIRRVEPLHTPRFAVHVDIRSYLHVTIRHKLESVGIEPTFDFVLKAIAGGAWRCLNALEQILRAYINERERPENKNMRRLSDGIASMDTINSLPFDHDALLPQSLRPTYVFYPNDLRRGGKSKSKGKVHGKGKGKGKGKGGGRDDKGKGGKDGRRGSKEMEASMASSNMNLGHFEGDLVRMSSEADLLPASMSNSEVDIEGSTSALIDTNLLIRTGLMQMDNTSHSSTSPTSAGKEDGKKEERDKTVIYTGKGKGKGGKGKERIVKERGALTLENVRGIDEKERDREEEEGIIYGHRRRGHHLHSHGHGHGHIEDDPFGIIKFLRKFPDFPGIVVNVARKSEPSTWKELFRICGTPVALIEKSIARNQLSTASKYLYVLEKIDIRMAMHFNAILMELAIDCGSDQLLLSLIRFGRKLKLIMSESHLKNIEIPQLDIALF